MFGANVIDGKIVNDLPRTEVDVTKSWAEPESLPLNSSVTVQLSAVSGTPAAPYALTGVVTEQTISASTTPTAWYFKWEDLPKYDETGNIIKFTVTETGITIAGEDKTEDLAEYQMEADKENTDYKFFLKNKIPPTSIRGVKNWIPEDLPEDTSVELTLKATVPNETAGEAPVDVTIAVLPQGAYVVFVEEKTTPSEGEKKGVLDYTDLPIGKYQLVETEAPAGYAILVGEIKFEITGDGVVPDNSSHNDFVSFDRNSALSE